MGFEPSTELFSADGKRTEMEWQGVPDSRCSNAKTTHMDFITCHATNVAWTTTQMLRLEKTTESSPHHMAQHHSTGSETSPSYAPRSGRFSSEPPSVEDDVDVWHYAIVSCMPETMTTTCHEVGVAGNVLKFVMVHSVSLHCACLQRQRAAAAAW